MAIKLPKCKITVLKRIHNQDLIGEFISNSYQNIGPCERFEEGQEFIIDPAEMQIPEKFCAWAWGDIRKDIATIAYGGDIPGMNQSGTVITGCTDWFRPVIFKVERME